MKCAIVEYTKIDPIEKHRMKSLKMPQIFYESIPNYGSVIIDEKKRQFSFQECRQVIQNLCFLQYQKLWKVIVIKHTNIFLSTCCYFADHSKKQQKI